MNVIENIDLNTSFGIVLDDKASILTQGPGRSGWMEGSYLEYYE